MLANVLIAMGALAVIGAGGFAVAWVAFTPDEAGSKGKQFEMTFNDIQRNLGGLRAIFASIATRREEEVSLYGGRAQTREPTRSLR
jgi:hypothetical protein